MRILRILSTFLAGTAATALFNAVRFAADGNADSATSAAARAAAYGGGAYFCRPRRPAPGEEATR